MKIKKIIIEGYKGFEKRTVLNFSEKTTAIVGVNGSGKTSILECLNFFFKNLFNLLNQEYRLDQNLDENININKQNAVCILTLSSFAEMNSIDVKFKLPKEALEESLIGRGELLLDTYLVSARKHLSN